VTKSLAFFCLGVFLARDLASSNILEGA